MERIVQRLNSPNLKRRSVVVKAGNFGVPLKTLTYKKTLLIPKIVSNICNFLLQTGRDLEGIFRINGSAKVITNLKTEFDVTCAENLEDYEYPDIHSICGALKLFLREIPGGIIPEAATNQTVKIMGQLKDEIPPCVLKLNNVVTSLPLENYNLLKYLCQFLRIFVSNDVQTKMSASNMGIVFGPCFFKCGNGIQGLRHQSLSNLATTYFIVYFDDIFCGDEAISSPSKTGCDSRDFAPLHSATSLNSLLLLGGGGGGKRRLPPRRSVVAALEASGKRLLSPRGDGAASPTSRQQQPQQQQHYLGLTATSSLSLTSSGSSARKCSTSEAEESDIGSHATLALELAGIMTSISIPSIAEVSAEKITGATPVPSPPPPPSASKRELPTATPLHPTSPACAVSTHDPPEGVVAAVDLTKSLPSLVYPHRWQQRLPRPLPTAQSVDIDDEAEGRDCDSASDSSNNSLLGESVSAPVVGKICAEVETEPTQTLILIQEVESICHAHMLSSNTSDVFPTRHDPFPPSDIEPVSEQPASITSPRHFFPRANKSRSHSHQWPSPCQPSSTATELYMEHNAVEVLPPCEEFGIPPFVEAKLSTVSDQNLFQRTSLIVNPRVLVANPVGPNKPHPKYISTWPRKRNILNRLNNRRSLNVIASSQYGLLSVNKVRILKPRCPSPVPTGEEEEGKGCCPQIAELTGFLHILEAVLESRRADCHRPEDIEKMSEEELAQEKIDLQKCLLYFECEKGHPTDAPTKRLMKPIYDRYRKVRRMVRLSSGSAIRRPSDFLVSKHDVSSGWSQRARSSGAAPFDEAAKATEFVVLVPTVVDTATTASSISYPTLPPLHPSPPVVMQPQLGSASPAPPALSQTEDVGELNSFNSNTTSTTFTREASEKGQKRKSLFLDWTITLAEFARSLQRLPRDQISRGRVEVLSTKHKLQRVLHDFEKRIQESTNRPPSKCDRDALRAEYNHYRDLKQRIFVIDRLQENPEVSLESLLTAALPVGRVHRHRNGGERSAGNHQDREEPMLPITVFHGHDGTSCT